MRREIYDCKENNECFRKIAECSGVWIWEISSDGTILYASALVEEILGYKPEELTGMNFFELFPEENRSDMKETALRLLGRNEIFRNFEAINVHRNKKLVILEISGMPVMNECGKVTGYRGIAKEITERKRFEKELIESEERYRLMVGHLEEVREMERKKVSRDIHDILGSSLAVMRMELTNLSENLSPDCFNHNPEIFQNIRNISGMIQDTITLMRKIIREMRPEIIEELGITEAIIWYAGEIRERTGMHFDISVPPDEYKVDPARSLAIFRIFQEILTNVVHHSKANHVKVIFEVCNQFLTLEVTDNGIGITEEQMKRKESFGVLGMKERALLLKGMVSFTGIPGKGTTVKLTIPKGISEEISA